MAEGRIAVWIDQEIYSNLSYPDVLVSALHEVMKGLASTLDKKDPFGTFNASLADDPR